MVHKMARSLSSILPRSLELNQFLSLSREKMDDLILIFACLLIIGIHSTSLPLWLSVSAFLIMFWRLAVTWRGNALPPTWILIPISLLLMLAIYRHYLTLLGREVGVAILIILLSCKTLEMHRKRDLFVVVFLGFFLLLAHFFQSQSMGSALQVMIASIVLLVAQISAQFVDKAPTLWVRCKIILKMIALAIPLTLFGFFLFPRLEGPLWGSSKEANSARSGLSDSMSPGNISKLALSEEIAFRVKFLDPPPDKSLMYWRGTTLNAFDGRTWTQNGKALEMKTTQLDFFEQAVRYEVSLEATHEHHLFALDMPRTLPQIEGLKLQLRANGELYAQEEIAHRIRYQVASSPFYRFDVNPRSLELQGALSIPPHFNPRTRLLAVNLLEDYPKTQARIDAILQLFRKEKFFYTLEPPTLGLHSVDEFLFNTRAGFCEHYASAFVYLMRATGVPARVVIGYQGGNINPVDGILEVRQSDAHAWAEVWTKDLGWQRVDPTAAIAPERITRNRHASARSSLLGNFVGDLIGPNPWFAQIGAHWSALNNRWNQWILNFDEKKQHDLSQYLGLITPNNIERFFKFALIIILIFAALSLPLWRHRPHINKSDQLYSQLCQRLASMGHRKLEYEGPFMYDRRLSQTLTQNQYRYVKRFIALYIAIQYGRQSKAPSETHLHAHAEMKKALRQLRRA